MARGEGRVVHRGDGDVDRRRSRVQRAVIGPEGEAVGAVKVEVGRVGESGRSAAERPASRLGEDQEGEGISVGIGPAQRDGQGSVFWGPNVLRACDGRVIDRGDIEGDRCSRRIHGSVVHDEGKAVRSDITVARGIS